MVLIFAFCCIHRIGQTRKKCFSLVKGFTEVNKHKMFLSIDAYDFLLEESFLILKLKPYSCKQKSSFYDIVKNFNRLNKFCLQLEV